MSLGNYSDLTAAVADYVSRSDLTSVIPTFIMLAENMMNYGDAGNDIEPLRVREMEATASTAPDAAGSITLASDFLEMKRVAYTSNPRVPLTYLSPTDLDATYGSTDSGDPIHYTIIGSTLTHRPTGGSNIEYVYYQQIPALTSGNSTNWLMTKAATAYLYGALFQEAIYSRDPDGAQAMLGLYRNAILGLERSDRGILAGSFVVRSGMPAW